MSHALAFAIAYGGFLLIIWWIDRKPFSQENHMRDYSRGHDREVRWYESVIAWVAFAIIMVIGPPILWVCDHVTDPLLDRLWPNRPKPKSGRIP
jgi:hypothetical protein